MKREKGRCEASLLFGMNLLVKSLDKVKALQCCLYRMGTLRFYLYIAFVPASSVFIMSETMVMGPTPPGTGVM